MKLNKKIIITCAILISLASVWAWYVTSRHAGDKADCQLSEGYHCP